MMIPKTKKLFISYRSSDHREVDYIAQQLRSLKHNDGVVKYKTWQDKHDLKGGKSWWDGIVDAIIDCDMFVFHLTREYLASKVCLAELDYALERSRPIIPVVLDSAYFINQRTKKPDIDFWEDIPEWLGKYQFIFYNKEDFLSRFEDAVAEYELAWPKDISARRPLNPDADSLHGSSYEVYATATDHALKVMFDEAKPLFRELVQRQDEDFADICHQWLEVINHYQDLLDAKAHRAPRAVFQRKWEAYVALFPVDFINDLYPDLEEHSIIFDPCNLVDQRHLLQKKAQPQLNSLSEKPIHPIPSPNESRILEDNTSLSKFEHPRSKFQFGMHVYHPKFGNGKVIGATRDIVDVIFDGEPLPKRILPDTDGFRILEDSLSEKLVHPIPSPNESRILEDNTSLSKFERPRSKFQFGMHVYHPKFGNGKVIGATRDIVDVIFDGEPLPKRILPDTDGFRILEDSGVRAKPTSQSFMPKPFEWIKIPDKDYSIAKYPTTNAQFRKFIKADGYNRRKWWIDEGWEYREKEDWTEPRYWTNVKWNTDNQPVIGISWFESIAFCLWLSEVTGEHIMLPTEDQWQFAAQGTDGRAYPWGNDWNRNFCNNNVDKKGVGKTTSVTQYEGKGDSPFGVVEMVGNVWEWCLTDYENRSNNIKSQSNKRVVRGGSWFGYSIQNFRTDFRLRHLQNDWTYSLGFRITRL